VGRLRDLLGVPGDYLRVLREASARDVLQGVVLDRGRVLLAVRRELRGWELPGGAPRPGESPEDALRREVLEETGVEVEVEALVGDYHRSGFRPHHARVFRCRPLRGETPRVAWFSLSELPATLFPWFRGPLEDAVAGRCVRREEHQGLAAVLAGLRIDLRMRWSGG
jgi:8-oxo-dGTP diphosphatase